MRATQPLNRLKRFMPNEDRQGWRVASVFGERSYLAPDGWALTWRGLVVYDLVAGRNVLLPAWTYHGEAKDARGLA